MAGREVLGSAVLELVTDPTKLHAGMAAARAETLATVTSIQKSLTSIGSAFSAAGSKMTIGITAPVLAIGGAITKVATEFDTSLKQVVGLTDVTSSEIAGIRDQILELGKTV